MPGRLDDPGFVLGNDPSGLMGLTTGFPDQCRKALSISRSVEFNGAAKNKSNVVVAGMGGSAAGGDYLKALFWEEGQTPCEVWRDYRLPKYVDGDTLVFACSYSGNTEETLSAVAEAKERGAAVVGITSGGELQTRCEQNGWPLIRIPSGQPPRTALGFLLIPLVDAAVRTGYLPEQDFDSLFDELDRCAADFAPAAKLHNNPTKAMASMLYGRVILVYGLGAWQALVANRWKGQLNENAKVMAFANAFPELNHNEIVGWTLACSQNASHWATVILEGGLESIKMRARADITADIIKEKSEVFRASSRGESLLEQMLTLSYFGDFVSLYLAALYGVNPEEITSIHRLKRALSELD